MKPCLIVEDNIETAQSLKCIIEPLGFSCSIATTIKDSCKIATMIKPELLIIDKKIGNDDGTVFASGYLRENPNTKAVVYTGARIECDFPENLVVEKPHIDKLVTKIQDIFKSPNNNINLIILERINSMECKIEQHCELLGRHEERLESGEKEFKSVLNKIDEVNKKTDSLVFKIFGMLIVTTALTLGGFYITVRSTVKDIVHYEVFNQIKGYLDDFKKNQ